MFSTPWLPSVIECRENVFSIDRMCSVSTECVLYVHHILKKSGPYSIHDKKSLYRGLLRNIPRIFFFEKQLSKGGERNAATYTQKFLIWFLYLFIFY